MEFILTVFFFIIIIGFLVLVHEFGHFAAAKLSGVTVNEFAIGFGPIILSRTIGETNYQLRLLPLGGFVSMEGEKDRTFSDGFRQRRFRTKAFILLGGVIMNFFFAVIFLGIYLQSSSSLFLPKIFDYTFNNTSRQVSVNPVQISNPDNFWKWELNINSQDLLVAIDNSYIQSPQDFISTLKEKAGQSVTMEFLDLNNQNTYKINAKLGEKPSGYDFLIRVDQILDNGNAKDVLEVGDVIYAVDGINIISFEDFKQKRDQSLVDGNVALGIINTSGSKEQKLIEIKSENPDAPIGIVKSEYLGINVQFSNLELYIVDYADNIFAPVSFTIDMARYQVGALANIISNAFSTGNFEALGESVGGPVAVTNMINTLVERNLFSSIVFLTGLLSLSLAIFNLLPIPALDGGQLAISFVETLRKKNLRDEFINRINMFGFIILMFLSFLIFLKDLFQFDVIVSFINLFNTILGR